MNQLDFHRLSIVKRCQKSWTFHNIPVGHPAMWHAFHIISLPHWPSDWKAWGPPWRNWNDAIPAIKRLKFMKLLTLTPHRHWMLQLKALQTFTNHYKSHQITTNLFNKLLVQPLFKGVGRSLCSHFNESVLASPDLGWTRLPERLATVTHPKSSKLAVPACDAFLQLANLIRNDLDTQDEWWHQRLVDKTI